MLSTSITNVFTPKARIRLMGIGDEIRRAREARGLSQRQLGKKVGISQAAIQKIEDGDTKRSRYLPDIRRLVGLGESDREVPVVGYVGASAEAHYYADAQGPLDEVPAPPGATAQTVAVEVRGTSLGELFNGWLVFYDEVRSPITEELIAQLCVVGLPDGRVLVKKIKRSKTAGFYHLYSQTSEGTITDVEVEWGARVKHMAPRF